MEKTQHSMSFSYKGVLRIGLYDVCTTHMMREKEREKTVLQHKKTTITICT